MGKLVRRIVRRFADWLDRKAQRMEEIAYGLGAWAREPVDRNDELSRIIDATLRNIGPQIAAHIRLNNALLIRLNNG